MAIPSVCLSVCPSHGWISDQSTRSPADAMGGRPYCPHTSTITRYVFERSTRSVDVRRAPAPAGHHSEFLQTVFFYLHDITVRSVADLNSTTLVQRQTHGSQSTPVQSIRHTFNVRLVTRSQLRPSSHRRLVDHGFWSAEIGRGAQSRVTHAACSLKSLTVDKRSSYLRELVWQPSWQLVGHLCDCVTCVNCHLFTDQRAGMHVFHRIGSKLMSEIQA